MNRDEKSILEGKADLGTDAFCEEGRAVSGGEDVADIIKGFIREKLK